MTDPRAWQFDPTTIPVCLAGAASDDCLSATQMNTVQRLHAGPTNPRTGERIHAGLALGSEDQPLGPTMQGNPSIWPAQQFYPFRWALGAAFEPSKFDFDRDLDRVDAQLAGTLNANSADLSSFARRGAKLLLYTGLSDPAVPFSEVINYHERVVSSSGGAAVAGDFARLLLVPGMGHCFGGPGVTDMGQPFTSDVPANPRNDALMTLVAWAEGGEAPNMLVARKPASDGKPAQERTVCAYPALPEFRGGDANKSASYTCTSRARGTKHLPAARYLN